LASAGATSTIPAAPPVPLAETAPAVSVVPVAAMVAEKMPQDRTKKTTSAKPPPSAAAGSQPAAPKPASPKLNCDPNYYLDAQGEKHFKPECF
jgi:hypothetical protein